MQHSVYLLRTLFATTRESVWLTWCWTPGTITVRTSELRSCVSETGSGRPGLPVANCPYCLCGRKATVKRKAQSFRAQELCKSGSGRTVFVDVKRHWNEELRAQELCKSGTNLIISMEIRNKGVYGCLLTANKLNFFNKFLLVQFADTSC